MGSIYLQDHFTLPIQQELAKQKVSHQTRKPSVVCKDQRRSTEDRSTHKINIDVQIQKSNLVEI
jgi:hypothetical protein